MITYYLHIWLKNRLNAHRREVIRHFLIQEFDLIQFNYYYMDERNFYKIVSKRLLNTIGYIPSFRFDLYLKKEYFYTAAVFILREYDGFVMFFEEFLPKEIKPWAHKAIRVKDGKNYYILVSRGLLIDYLIRDKDHLFYALESYTSIIQKQNKLLPLN